MVYDLRISPLRDRRGDLTGRLILLRDITERVQAEETQRQSSQFNQAIISSAHEGIIVYDRQLRYVVWNRFMEELTGMPAEQVLGKWALDLFPHLREQGVDRLLERARAGETVTSVDTPFRVPQTSKAGWVSGTYGPNRDANGDIIGVIGLVRDITERKRAEEEQRQRQEWIRRQHEALIRLSTHPALAEGRLDEALPALTEAAAGALDVERVNVWRLSPDGGQFRCLEAFERSPHEHTAGQVLQPEGYPEYFAALEAGLVVDAADVATDPRTAELTADYWDPLGIGSCLDAPIRLHGEVVGTVCHEHVGAPRPWRPDEVNFARQIADLVAQAFLNADVRRHTAELEALRKVSLEITAQLELSGLLENIVRRAAELLGANGGGLYLYRPEQEELELVVSYNLGADYTGHRLQVGEGLSGRIVATGQPLMVDDYHTWEGRAAQYQGAAFAAVIGVPLRWEDRILGAINVTDPGEREPFDENDRRLLEAFAQQAAIAIENARLHEDVRQRLEQLDVLYRVAEAGSRTLELESLLEELLERVLAVTGTQIGAIYRVDRATRELHLLAHRNLPPGFVDQVRAYAPGEGISGQALAGGQTVICEDAFDVPELRAKAEQAEFQSQISLPLRATDEIVGVLNLNSVEPRAWATEEVRWLETIARQAAVAIENARLFETAEQRAAALEILHQASLSLTASLELEVVLDAILKGAFKILPEIQNAHIFLYRDDGLTFGAARWVDEGTASRPFAEPRRDGLTYTVAREGEPIVVPDTRTHPLFTDAPPDWSSAIVGLPLEIGQRVVGVMNVAYPEPRAFPEPELRVLRLLGYQAAVAIENARLFEAEQVARRRAETLQEVAAALSATLDLGELVDRVLEGLQKVVPFASASVQLLRGDQLEIIAGRGFSKPEEVIGLTFPLAGENPHNEVIAKKRPAVVSDAHASYAGFKEKPHSHIRSWLGVPLLSKDQVIGIIALDRTEVNAFSQDEAGIALAFANNVAIALENARLFDEVQRLAVTDPLTGLYNRRGFSELGRREVERAQRFGRPLSAIMFDIDRFKRVNDTRGHAAGDQVLARLANRWQQQLRDVDVLGRYGGEEFVALLPEIDLADARQVAERLRRDTEQTAIETEEGPVTVTISLGVTVLDGESDDLEDLLKNADQALYTAKQAGRNRVAVSES